MERQLHRSHNERYYRLSYAGLQLYDVELEPGDVMVFGSDGLFDNVWDRDIAAVVTDSIKASSRAPCSQMSGLWTSAAPHAFSTGSRCF